MGSPAKVKLEDAGRFGDPGDDVVTIGALLAIFERIGAAKGLL